MEKTTSKISAPKRWLLRRLYERGLQEGYLGDIEEEYDSLVSEKGKSRAAIWLWSQILKSVPGRIASKISWSATMLKNHLKFIVRNLSKQKMYSAINILGLAVGMACCLLIVKYISFELSYDNYHKDADRVFRIGIDINQPDFKRTFAAVCYRLAPHLRENYPQVEKAGRLLPEGSTLIKNRNQAFYENNFYYADPDILQILTIPFLSGNPERALANPGSIVLTERMAKKYFGSENALGKNLAVNSQDYLVTGIVNDPPPNTHFKYGFIAALPASRFSQNGWWDTMFLTYVKFAPHADTAAFLGRVMKEVRDGVINSGKTNTYFLQPIKDIHLRSRLAGELEPPGNPGSLKTFSVLAALILILAAVNFINLSTARSAGRAKEIGVRKVVGAVRKQLLIQFLGESVFTALLSVFVGFVIIVVSLPLFSKLVGVRFSLGDFLRFDIFIALIAIIVFSGLIAGSYPALFLSAFRPVLILKGKIRSGTKSKITRKIMVTGQFAISIVLMIGTIVQFKQLRYMKNASLGFSKEQKLIIPFRTGANLSARHELIKAEMSRHPRIAGATVSNGVPGRFYSGANIRLLGETDNKSQWMYYLFVDKNFIPEYGIQLTSGKLFEGEDLPTMRTERNVGVILNETAVRDFGWTSPQEALGRRLTGWFKQGEVIGVVKDFHFQGLQQEIGPVVICNYPGGSYYLTLTVSTEELSRTMSFVQDTWKTLCPGIPLTYYFLDEDFNRLYLSEEKAGTLSGVFTLMGILVACLGLFGLSSFMAEQLNKEIAIRKIHGAQLFHLVGLQIKDFLKWIFIANLVGWPIAYFVSNRWLENFAYRIQPNLGLFVLAGGIVLFTALSTVSYQTLKAAAANPVEALRNE